MMTGSRITRRRVLGGAALATASAVVAPRVRGEYAAGKLSIAAWEHWVPGANETLARLCDEWGTRNRVEVHLDFVANSLAANTEARGRSGHDIVAHPSWQIVLNRRLLEPVDDVVADLIGIYGPVSPVAEYLGRHNGTWRGVPATSGSMVKPCCSRLDLYRQHCALDLSRVFPPDDQRDDALVDSWTWELYLHTAERLFKAGHPVGLPMSHSSDAVDWTGAMFQSFGAVMVDQDGAVRIDSDQTRAGLEFMTKLLRFNARDAYAWDDTGNNRWLISGKGSGIINPPSAWAVAKRDNPRVAEQCWTHDMPRGPAGRFVAQLPVFYGIWTFSRNQQAAKELLRFISEPEQVRRLVAASNGADMPLFRSLHDLDAWRNSGPPHGTLYNYPPRGDQRVTIAGMPAPPDVASQIYNTALQVTMVTRLTRNGDTVDGAIKWAERELEGFLCVRSSRDCA